MELQDKANTEASRAKKAKDNLEVFRAYRDSIIAKASFPIAGLSFGRDELVYNGFPFSQASDADRLRVACAVVMAQNKRLRVIRVRQGSLLDPKSSALLEQLAEEMDFQVWKESVTMDRNVGIHIIDGEIVAMDGEEVKKEDPVPIS